MSEAAQQRIEQAVEAMGSKLDLISNRDPGDETEERYVIIGEGTPRSEPVELTDEYVFVTVTYRFRTEMDARIHAHRASLSPFWVCHSIETADDQTKPYEPTRLPHQ